MTKICDKQTDPEGLEGPMVSGQCYCKTNVGGVRCDQCKNGFWNFTIENPDGCQGKAWPLHQEPFFAENVAIFVKVSNLSCCIPLANFLKPCDFVEEKD